MSVKYFQPESVEEAVALLSQYGYDAKLIAGGTAVVLMLQQKLIAPAVLVSVDRIAGLNYVRTNGDGLHIGPTRTLYQVAHTPVVQAHYPALAHACDVVGNIRIRHQATLGGNLAEADYASDPPAVLSLLDASVEIRGASGARTVPLSEFFLGFYTTILEPDEMITDIYLPPLPPQTRITYYKFRTRSSEDRPCVGVAALAHVKNGRCTDLRVAIGAATETPQRLPDVEALAHGQPLSDELIAEIAEQYAVRLETLDDLRGSAWYRSQMVRVHVKRALEEVRDGGR